jgi:hypothetical protein
MLSHAWVANALRCAEQRTDQAQEDYYNHSTYNLAARWSRENETYGALVDMEVKWAPRSFRHRIN